MLASPRNDFGQPGTRQRDTPRLVTHSGRRCCATGQAHGGVGSPRITRLPQTRRLPAVASLRAGAGKGGGVVVVAEEGLVRVGAGAAAGTVAGATASRYCTDHPSAPDTRDWMRNGPGSTAPPPAFASHTKNPLLTQLTGGEVAGWRGGLSTSPSLELIH